MSEAAGSDGRVEPFCRCWHVIKEIDVARLVAGHHRLAALCHELEACADALPTLPSPTHSVALCRLLAATVVRREGDRGNFPEALAGKRDTGLLAPLLMARVGRLRLADAAYGQELIEALEDARHSQPVAGETLGYLLRCVFEGCRRTMDVEGLVVLHLASHRLTAEARMLLVESLRRRSAV
ncbi:hypothetical protein [Stakelama saccharophila]|uniref:Uncharacterized protein n=1 Tax=Stakelama saccharophila TaxID=3075605 RepID=A0ABZ0B886_9SPHN|nr:hypothetical protein [Stakelama sp. W311]WNO53609.1 hypothetical protein RPR59_14410 [Stakelama sp. W311]